MKTESKELYRSRLEMPQERYEKHWKNLFKRKGNFGARRKRVGLKFEYPREKKRFTRHLILCSPVTIHISYLRTQPITLPFHRTCFPVILSPIHWCVLAPTETCLIPWNMTSPTSSLVSSPEPMESSTLLLSRPRLSLSFTSVGLPPPRTD